MTNEPKSVYACRACGGGPLDFLFSLGDQYVSTFPLPEDVNAPDRCPIELVRCPRCTLVQQRYTVPSELLYSRHYWYRSGTTGTMRRALADVVDSAMSRVELRPGDVVLDIGSNDGTLLRQYPEGLELTKVAVEPASNMRQFYERNRWSLISDFWSERAYRKALQHRQAKIVTACGMLYDLDDPTAFVRDVYAVLAGDGLFVAQLQCLRQTVELRDVGNLCHEHLEFYTLASLLTMFARVGLVVERVETNDVNGGSYRLYARKAQAAKVDETVEDALDREEELGLTNAPTLARFGEQLRGSMENLWQTVESIVRAGKTVWVYGASTKGNVILQAAGIDKKLVYYAADRSLEKVGRVTPGTGILIRSEADFRAASPDFALVLPYAFLPEFTEREAEWRRRGGKWIVPVPEVRVV